MGQEAVIDYIDMPESIRHQYQYFTRANMSKFNQLLPNFKFSLLEQAVEDYVKHYLVKQQFYAD